MLAVVVNEAVINGFLEHLLRLRGCDEEVEEEDGLPV